MASSPVSEAFERYRKLSHILEYVRRVSLENPTGERNVELGLTTLGQPKRDAVRSIEQSLEDLGGLVSHLAILDMAAAFEDHVRSRLATAVGEARRVVRRGYRENTPFHRARERLIHGAEDFQGMSAIIKLIRGHVSQELIQDIESIRENRNKLSHGTDVHVPPTITIEKARDTLQKIIDAL